MKKIRADKIIFEESELSKVERMASLGLSVDQIAGVMGCSADTFYRRIKEGDTQLSAAIQRGRNEAILLVSKKCFELALGGDVGLIKYILSCKGGWTEKSQLNVEGSKNDVQVLLSTDQIRTIAKELLMKHEIGVSNE